MNALYKYNKYKSKYLSSKNKYGGAKDSRRDSKGDAKGDAAPPTHGSPLPDPPPPVPPTHAKLLPLPPHQRGIPSSGEKPTAPPNPPTL